MFSFYEKLSKELSSMKEQGVYKHFHTLTSPQGPSVTMQGRGEVIVLSSNNYLGLANHPELIAAGKNTIDKLGCGTASVRFICGTFDIHHQLEQKIAQFVGTQAAVSYMSCWNANTGLFATFLGEEDIVISDSLNHASIIDGCRMAIKAKRAVYAHDNMTELENLLKENQNSQIKMIVTDGVFSMEGHIAKLPDIVALSKKYNAITVVDDSHATGVLGKTGRGTAEHYGMLGEVDIITGTFGKALGGAAGGFIAGKKEVIEYLHQKSRPQLFSNALPPAIAAISHKAIEVLDKNPSLLQTLHENTSYFRTKIKELGYKPLDGNTPIVPIIVGDTALAISLSEKLLENGVFVTGFGYPVVPKGEARLRVQISAALTQDLIDKALLAFQKVSKFLS